MEHDLARVTALLRGALIQQVLAESGTTAGHAVVVDVLAAGCVPRPQRAAQDDQPGDDDDPVTPGGEPAQPLQQVVHACPPARNVRRPARPVPLTRRNVTILRPWGPCQG